MNSDRKAPPDTCAGPAPRPARSRASRSAFNPVTLSLADILGADFVEAVCEGRSFLTGEPIDELRALARQRVDFLPDAAINRMHGLLSRVGDSVITAFRGGARGASSQAFVRNSSADGAPVSTDGPFRLNQSGRLRFITKSEHYHAPLGHCFQGYRLISHARSLGLANATHNNTRGHVTRLLEEELVRVANGVAPGDHAAMTKVLETERRGVPNRVLNLETGSLAVEAGLKLMLCRFYRPENVSAQPVYADRQPVFLVVGDDDGDLGGNYHGTPVLLQALRGMWPDFAAALDRAGAFHVRAVRPNRPADLREAFERFEKPPFKIAGFLHEIVMMNYGGLRLDPAFLHEAYELCRRADVPILADEIQSCVWAPGFFLAREYGLDPDMLACGKGLPGGEYAASRLIFASPFDFLPQFGALVTNGQEELASLAYLVTMRWAEANADPIARLGDYYQERLQELAAENPAKGLHIEGSRHMAGLHFRDLETAKRFTTHLDARGLDISVQTYKPTCPPAALTKIPLICDRMVIDFVVDRMAEALAAI